MTVALALEWALVFIVVFLADVCWATYVSRVKDRDKVKASNWAAILFLMTGIATISFVKDYWLLIPACAGAWLGTYVALWCEIRWASWEEFTDEFFGNKTLL